MDNFIFIKDSDSHWYRIPKKDKEEFNQLLDEYLNDPDNYEKLDAFEEKFSKYMIGCEPSYYYEWIKEKDKEE